MSTAIRNTYNFAPSFCYFVPKYMADLLTRDYNKDTIDLSDIDVHNGIEHDASLFRKWPVHLLTVTMTRSPRCGAQVRIRSTSFTRAFLPQSL